MHSHFPTNCVNFSNEHFVKFQDGKQVLQNVVKNVSVFPIAYNFRYLDGSDIQNERVSLICLSFCADMVFQNTYSNSDSEKICRVLNFLRCCGKFEKLSNLVTIHCLQMVVTFQELDTVEFVQD